MEKNPYINPSFPTKVLFLFLISGLGIVSCKKDCLPDPCEGIELPTGDFQTGYKLWGWDWRGIMEERFIPSTIMTAGDVYFQSLNADPDSVKWQLGFDPRTFEGNTFHLEFPDAGTYEVRNHSWWAIDFACFPSDSGHSYSEKNFTIIPGDSIPYFGFYQGYFLDDKHHPFTLEIRKWQGFAEPPKLINFPDGESYPLSRFSLGYHVFNFYEDYGINRSGWGYYYPETEDLIIDAGYWHPGLFAQDSLHRLHRIWVGKKI